jgi:hypothetical protein
MEESLTEFCFLEQNENRKTSTKKTSNNEAYHAGLGFSSKYSAEPAACVKARAQAYEQYWQYAQQCVEQVTQASDTLSTF